MPKPDETPRYSKSIPPELRGKISGTYRIDVEKIITLKRTHESFEKMPGEKRKEWLIGGVLLQAFDAWKILPPEITEKDCEERTDILHFIAGKKEHCEEYGKLPSIEAIAIELGRLILGMIEEWNRLDRVTQFTLEADLIKFINQNHREFRELPSHEPDDMQILLSDHAPPKKSANHKEIQAEIRRKILKKIADRITALVREMEREDDSEAFAPTTYTHIADVSRQTSRNARRAINPPQLQETGPRPTIPAAPFAIRAAGEKPDRKK